MGEFFGTDGIWGEVNVFLMILDMVICLGCVLGVNFQSVNCGGGWFCIVVGKDICLFGYIFE